jgi:hypothetical protein
MTTDRSTAPVRSGSDGMALGSLITGIVGAVTAWLIAIVGLLLGIVAVVLGLVARRNGGASGQATAGLALGALAIVMAVVNMVIAYQMLT